MARSLNAFESIIPNVQAVAFFQDTKGQVRSCPEFKTRMGLEGFLKLILRITIQTGNVNKIIQPKTRSKPIGIGLVEVYFRGICNKVRDKAKMVCMEMSNKKVCFSYIHSKLRQTRLHGLHALFLIPACIDNHVALR